MSGCGEEERPPLADEVIAERDKDFPYERLPETSDAFEEVDCRVSVKGASIQCGVVTVPASPDSDETMEIAVARVFSKSKSPEADPIVYLEGGPGAASLQSLEFLVEAFAPLLAKRDLIFVDQRGTGQSTPSLDCYDEGTDLLEMLDACYTRVSKKTTPAFTNSVANARDFEAIRRAYGYEQWNLYGISYGTRLGLTIARDFPGGVRSLVVDSVVPLQIDLVAGIGENSQKAFEVAFAACAADAACAAKYPDSMAQLREVASALEEKPAVIDEVELTSRDFLKILFQLLYSPSGVSVVPLIIDRAAAGDFSLFEKIGGGGGGGGGISFGMHLSLHCAEEVPFTSAEVIAERDATVFEELRQGFSGGYYLDYCEHWPVPAAPATENQAVTTSIPTLVFSGSFDPITPPAYAALVHEDNPGSQYFEIGNESHGASVGKCGMSLTTAFFDSPTEAVPVACLDTLGTIGFESTGVERRGGKIGSRVRFVTEAPSDDELEAIARDAERRRRW